MNKTKLQQELNKLREKSNLSDKDKKRIAALRSQLQSPGKREVKKAAAAQTTNSVKVLRDGGNKRKVVRIWEQPLPTGQIPSERKEFGE